MPTALAEWALCHKILNFNFQFNFVDIRLFTSTIDQCLMNIWCLMWEMLTVRDVVVEWGLAARLGWVPCPGAFLLDLPLPSSSSAWSDWTIPRPCKACALTSGGTSCLDLGSPVYITLNSSRKIISSHSPFWLIQGLFQD